MSEAQYATAPWYSTANNWQFTTVYDAYRVPVCQLDLEWWDVTEENQDELEARQAEVAALIAAAPDLLTALRGVLDHCCLRRDEMDGQGLDAHDRARAAIAKAEGR